MKEQKNKKLQYLLLGLVILIWGTLIYNFMSWSGDAEYLVSEDYTILPVNQGNSTTARDSFAIHLDWSDPFKANRSGKSRSSGSSSSSSAATAPKKKYTRPAPPPIPGSKEDKAKAVFPTIVYKGYSINNSQITRVRVSIDGKTQTMKLSERKNKLQLTQMTKDSVVFVWEGEQKTILRKRGY